MYHLEEPNPILENPRYQKLHTLGKGSFGSVLLARDGHTQEVAAVKSIRRTEVNKYVEGEIMNHSLLRHPHVIQFKEVFLTREYVCIVMEYATGGSLFHYVQRHGRLKEPVARWFFQQLILGVDYCHKKGVANRDIKLENTLLQEVPTLPLPLVKICDFGYSKADFRSAAKSKVGTLTYMAPEVLLNKEACYDGKTADIWSCGVMLFVMLCGRYPFEVKPSQSRATEIVMMLDKMVTSRFSWPRSTQVSPELKDLLTRLLKPDPNQRITMPEVMAHPWFTVNLPPDAPRMNETYLAMGSYPGAQPIETIKAIVQDARTSSCGGGPGADVQLEDVIDAEIQQELETYQACRQLAEFVEQYKG